MTSYIIPIIVIAVFSYAVFKKVDILDEFANGAKEGIEVTVKLLPTLMYVLTVVAVFRASGTADIFSGLCGRFLSKLSIPAELMPLLFMKSVSGSASIAMFSDIIKTYGVDGFLGRTAAIMTSSNETTLYTASVYGKGAGLKNTGVAIPVGLAADLFSGICAIFITYLFYGQ